MTALSAPLLDTRGEMRQALAIIPARGGSKGIPRKNVLPSRASRVSLQYAPSPIEING